ncbi:MAG: hypothetical protein JOZ31_11365 [Verrucomicrobia bacterium]|nr:hypothetical protein [Verrucomicrobiota bacterium]MBV8483431.1 hypothetical protein [Verrucomicrobiota bacterium]
MKVTRWQFYRLLDEPPRLSRARVNGFSARAEVVVPDDIAFVELFDLPHGVQATNLSDVAPRTHELLLYGDGEPPFKVGETLFARRII